MEFKDLIKAWVEDELPHFRFDPRLAYGNWIGFIFCSCEKSSPAVARVEIDKIVLISKSRVYGQAHRAACEREQNGDICYCGEDVLNIYNPDEFKDLKDRILARHSELLIKHDQNPA